MIIDPAREQSITRFGLRPLPGATRVTDAQIEQARQELRRHRYERQQAANEAVGEHMRENGPTNYQAAFTHILRTRPDLFADMQDPAGVVVAANFNPYHDPLGRFTTSDDTVAPHGRECRSTFGARLPKLDVHGHNRHPEHKLFTQRRGGDETGQTNAPKKEYDGKLTAGVVRKQDTATGHCLPLVMREAIAQVSKLQTVAMRARSMAQGAELYPDGSLQVDRNALEQGIRKENPHRVFDFASDEGGADPRDGRSTLAAYGVAWKALTQTNQIAEHLKNGPVLVATTEGRGHAQLITGIKADGSFAVYNPLAPGGRGSIKASQIIVSPLGNLLAFALTPSSR